MDTLPAFDGSLRWLRTLRLASRKLRDTKSERIQRKELEEKCGVSVSVDVLNDFVVKDSTPRADKFLSSFHEYLLETCEEYVKEAWIISGPEAKSGVNAISKGLQNMWPLQFDNDEAASLDFLSGSYTMYFTTETLSGKQVVVSKLSCGSSFDPYWFEIEIKGSRSGNDRYRYNVTGGYHIVGTCYVMIGRQDVTNESFLIKAHAFRKFDDEDASVGGSLILDNIGPLSKIVPVIIHKLPPKRLGVFSINEVLLDIDTSNRNGIQLKTAIDLWSRSWK